MPEISARHVTSALKKHVFPVLSEHGFEVIQPRQAFRRRGYVTGVIWYNCIGAYFASRTGFPSLSLTSTVGAHFDRLPNPWSDESQLDNNGYPRSLHASCELQCHPEHQPRTGLPQSEATRADIWWLEKDGSNLEQVITELAGTIKSQALPWLRHWDTEEAALASWLNEPRDYPGRTWNIYALAKAMARTDITDEYRSLLQKHWPKHYRALV